jgi:hypothetical protein
VEIVDIRWWNRTEGRRRIKEQRTESLEHAVTFVKDEVLDLIQLEGVLLEQTQDASGGAY